MNTFWVFTLTETSFTTTSYYWIFLVWSVNYANLVYKILHFENVKIHKDCLYWKVFSTDIHRKIYVIILLLFLASWSVNCTISVSKFNSFFLTCKETEARFVFEESSFLTPRYFFCFFIWSVNCVRDFFQSLCQSVNYMSWLFEAWNIPRRCHVT